MNFKAVKNPETNAAKEWNVGGSHIKESENYYLLILPVMFGWRVKLIRKNSYIYDLDLCAGDNLAMIQVLYNVVETILSDIEEKDLNALTNNFPEMETRPYYKDKTYLPRLMKMIPSNTDLIATEVNGEELMKGRERSFNPIIKNNQD